MEHVKYSPIFNSLSTPSIASFKADSSFGKGHQRKRQREPQRQKGNKPRKPLLPLPLPPFMESPNLRKMSKAKTFPNENGNGNGNGNANGWHGVNGDPSFDPSAPPPFRIGDIRAAIPPHCWIKNPLRSLSYVFRDLFIISALVASAVWIDNFFFWPIYWIAQGTMFWAVFVLGHDCGHGSFSDSLLLNNIVGLFLHSAILVPYHGWRISHRTHHQNHGNVEKDESWVPLTKKIYKQLGNKTKLLRFTLPFPILAYPFYLWWRSPGKEGSHFNPYSELFPANERKDIVISTICWGIMATILVYFSFVFGPIKVLQIYGVPYWIFVMWLDFVTYLHHHGYEKKLPWYRGEEWSYLRGGLTTIDRDYGLINNIHHDIGTHVIHHLFPQIPHYHLVEATKAAKPVLGKYYREPRKSGVIPFHLIKNLLNSLRQDHFVSDHGNIVFYQTDPDLFH